MDGWMDRQAGTDRGWAGKDLIFLLTKFSSSSFTEQTPQFVVAGWNVSFSPSTFRFSQRNLSILLIRSLLFPCSLFPFHFRNTWCGQRRFILLFLHGTALVAW